jgi:hypothetical protein
VLPSPPLKKVEPKKQVVFNKGKKITKRYFGSTFFEKVDKFIIFT